MTDISKTKNWTIGIVIFGILSLFIYVAPIWGRGPALFGVSLASASFFLFYLNKKQGIKSKLAVFALVISLIAFTGNAMTVYTGVNPFIIIDPPGFDGRPTDEELAQFRLADEDFADAYFTISESFSELIVEENTHLKTRTCRFNGGYSDSQVQPIEYFHDQSAFHIFKVECKDGSTEDVYFNIDMSFVTVD